MQMSHRAKRMERRNLRANKTVALNLVSLMDIFTILVFFLLVNSGQVETLPNSKDIKLPESIAEQKTRETVMITVTDEDILVQGHAVAKVDAVMAQPGMIIEGLEVALRAQSDRVLRRDALNEIEKREVTIMGDKELPYKLLKRVMATCTAADYGQISLAVMHRSKSAQASAGGPGSQG